MGEDKVSIIFFYRDSDGNVKRVCNFYTSRFGEWLKFLDYAEKNNIQFYPRVDDENIKDEIINAMDIGSYIEDLYVSFGSDDCIQCIEVVLK